MPARAFPRIVWSLSVVLAGSHPAQAPRPPDGPAAARLLVEQIRRTPAKPSSAAGQIGLYVLDVDGGKATLVANEPDPRFCQCGSSSWSRDGRRIYFDVTTGDANYSSSRIKAIRVADGRLAIDDLGPGNCPFPSPAGDRVVFILNPGAVPGAEAGVWLMTSDGENRRRLDIYGRPKWSFEGQQFLIIGFGDPRRITLIDIRSDRRSGALRVAGRNIYTPPSWAGDGTIVAVLGATAGDSIALLDVKDPEAKVKQTLWSRSQGPDIRPLSPVYAPETGTCVFVGEETGKGLGLYAIRRGKPGPPRRLEPDQHDGLLQSLSLSPGGRYVTFSSDRPSRPR